MTMRIYLREKATFTDNGAEFACPGPGFYNVPIGIGIDWVVDGKAYKATDANMIMAWDDQTPVIIDLDDGETIRDYYTTAQVMPEIEDQPDPGAEPVDETETIEEETE